MRIPSGWWQCSALVVVMVALFQAGCEVTSDDNEVTITPDRATVVLGQSVALHAEGADDFVWSLENEAWGTLNTVRGDTVIYTSRYAPLDGASVIQKVFASGNNAIISSNANALTASALITHVSGLIRISPSAATLRQGESVNLTASGGGSYTWTLSMPSYGILSKSTGNSVRYTSLYAAADGKAVVQTITITSDNGGSAVVLVTQEPGGIISIVPSSTTLRDGMSQIFTLYGGTEYSFAISQPTWGTITVLDSGTFKYTSTRETPPDTREIVTITVTDISSAKVTATVYNEP